MNRFAISGVGLLSMIGFISNASAADLAARPYTKAPARMMAPVASWTGCYVGGNIGYGWQKDTAADPGISTPGFSGPAGSDTASGVVGGGQIGCDIQTGAWVFGAQGMFDGAGIRDSHLNPLGSTAFDALGTKTRWFATETARIGYTITPQALLYVKGGAAEIRFDYSDIDPSTSAFSPFSGSASSTRVGWTVGGGLEYALTSNWSVFGEYNYMDFGTKRTSFSYTAPDPANASPYVYSETNRLQTVLVGLNYRFGLGGLGIAKY